jgi:hypothetical protein
MSTNNFTTQNDVNTFSTEVTKIAADAGADDDYIRMNFNTSNLV